MYMHTLKRVSASIKILFAAFANAAATASSILVCAINGRELHCLQKLVAAISHI